MNNKISFILSVCALIGIIVSGVVRFQTVEGKVIKAEEAMSQIEERLDNKIITDQIESKQERIWKLEDRFAISGEEALKEEIRQITQEIDNLQRKLDKKEELPQ